jgi:hypothetical protein
MDIVGRHGFIKANIENFGNDLIDIWINVDQICAMREGYKIENNSEK